MHKILTNQEVTDLLKIHKDWSVKDDKLYARFEFRDFKTAMAFINLVAFSAEEYNHHPGWTNSWNTVEFSYNTHDAGGKITDLDFKLAAVISEEAARLIQ